MPSIEGLGARRAALQMLDAVLRRGQTLDAAGGSIRNLSPQDHALAVAIAGETLRRLPDLDTLIDSATRLGQAAFNAQCVSEPRRRQIVEHLALRSSAAWSETEEGRADTLYAPYVERHQRQWEVVQRDSRVWIPGDLDFAAVPGLSNEMVERLNAARPETLDQASRVAGVTPAALSALYVAASRRAAA